MTNTIKRVGRTISRTAIAVHDKLTGHNAKALRSQYRTHVKTSKDMAKKSIAEYDKVVKLEQQITKHIKPYTARNSALPDNVREKTTKLKNLSDKHMSSGTNHSIAAAMHNQSGISVGRTIRQHAVNRRDNLITAGVVGGTAIVGGGAYATHKVMNHDSNRR